MDLASRIKQIIEYKGISVRKFCRETGLSNGFLDRVKDIGVSKLNKILSTYNEINPLWLLNGEGDMLIPGVTDRLKEDQEKYNIKNSKFSSIELYWKVGATNWVPKTSLSIFAANDPCR